MMLLESKAKAANAEFCNNFNDNNFLKTFLFVDDEAS